MSEIKRVNILKKQQFTSRSIIFFFSAYWFIHLFIADSSNMTTWYASRIVVPYIPLKTVLVLIALHALTLASLLWIRAYKIDFVALVLFLRIPLYFFPMIYCSGTFFWGDALAVILTFSAYLIGRSYQGTGKFIPATMLSVVFILCAQIFATLFINRLSLFSETVDVKFSMVLPCGQTNSVAALLIIAFVLFDSYNRNSDKKVYRLALLFLILIGIYGTGSRSALLIIAFYYMIKLAPSVLNLRKVKITKKSIFSAGIVLSGIIMVLVFWGKHLYTKVLSFGDSTVYNRLYVFADAIDLIIKHPLFGRSAYGYEVFDTSKTHNFLLESLVQTGVVGTIIYSVAWLIVVTRLFSSSQNSLNNMCRMFVIVTLVHGSIEPNLFNSLSDTFVWFILGVGVSNSWNKRSTTDGSIYIAKAY